MSEENISEEELYKQFEESVKPDAELEKKLFEDILLSDTMMLHFDKDGNMRRIVPFSEEYWAIKDKEGRDPYVFAKHLDDEMDKIKRDGK